MRKKASVFSGLAAVLAAFIMLTPIGGAAQEMEEIFNILEEHKQNPTTFADYDKLATMAYARGQYSEAIGYLDKCAELAGENAAVLGVIWTQKGAIYHKQAENAQALDALNKAAEHTPEYTPMLLERARVYMDQQEYGRAVRDMEQYTALLPESAEGWTLLAQAQRANGSREAGDLSQARADTLSQNEHNTVLTAARAAAQQGDLETAEAGYTAFLDGTGTDEGGVVHFLRATARMQLGKVEEAIADLESALTMGYGEPEICYEYLSSCQFVQQNYEKVLEAGEQVIALGSDKPAYNTLFQRMGIAAMALGDMQGAANYFSSAMNQDGALEGNYFYRGLTGMGMEKYADAIEDFGVSIERGELVQRCYYNRGLCYAQSGDTQAAIADLREALTMQDEPDISQAAEDTLWQLAMQYMQSTETTE